MKLKPIGTNQNELTLENGTVILFSYQTPVAAFNNRPHENGGFSLCKTEKKWSKTTSRHINNWASLGNSNDIPTKPQEFFNNLAA